MQPTLLAIAKADLKTAKKLVDSSDKYQYEVEVPDEIVKNAAMYTSWEVVTRYYPTTVIRRDMIAKAIRVTDKWQMQIYKKK